MRERELKLAADPGLTLPPPERLLAGLGSDWTVEEIDQEAVYFDTADLRLTRGGASLRFRSDDGWTVKLPESVAGASFVRQEHRFPGARGAPPGAASELVRAWTRSAPLVEVAHVRTRRTKVRVYDEGGQPVGEIDDDDVTATAVVAGARTRFREIELEMGDDADRHLVDTLVERLRETGAGNGASLPKVTRALGAPALQPPDVLEPGPLDRSASIGDLVRSCIARSVRRLLDHDPLVRASDDAESVHQARVATRRLRSDLRTLRPILDRGWSEPLRAELRWLGEQLGRVRDADVLLGLLEAKVPELPPDHRDAAGELIDRLRDDRDRDRERLLDAMRSSRYVALLDALVDAARAPRVRPTRAERRATRAARTLARKPGKRVRRSVERLPALPADGDLHEVRKRAKQARYAFEAITPVTGRHAARTAERLEDLQDVLGDHQDAVVASAWLHDAARDASGPDPCFVAGELAASFARDRRRLRRAWPRAWKRAERALR